MDDQSITSKVVSWVTSLTADDIPPSTRHAALRSLYNYLGCTLHGSSHPTVARALEALQPLFGSPTANLFGTSHTADAQHAALLNGIASHVHDYDDTHLATIIHPTGCVASALLAYVQHISASSSSPSTVTGEVLLTALTAGIEVACKLGLAVYPRHYDAGWHITSTTGSIGAAAALCNLMSLTPAQTAHALGIAATQVTGLRANFGSDTKSFHVGRAAQNGLLAALLAQHDFTAASGSIEARRGWANVVTGGTAHNADVHLPSTLSRLISELGQVWETENNSFKPFPCGIVAHPTIDAAVRLRKQLLGHHNEDEAKYRQQLTSLKFVARVHPLVIELTSNPSPRDGLEAKFSAQHGIAAGLVFGKAGPAEYDDALVQSHADTVRVRDAVTLVADETVRSDETWLQALDEKEEVVSEVHVEHAVGSLHVPLSDQQLCDKFVDQVGLDGSRERAERLSALCWGLGGTEDIGAVLKQLVA